MSDLTELGQEAIAAVSRGVADGAPLVKCQLLASAFYEALRHELRKADATKRSSLLAVTDHCHRSAAAGLVAAPCARRCTADRRREHCDFLNHLRTTVIS
jgi:hypothetical protein